MRAETQRGRDGARLRPDSGSSPSLARGKGRPRQAGPAYWREGREGRGRRGGLGREGREQAGPRGK
jgi:hypothetical protein